LHNAKIKQVNHVENISIFGEPMPRC